MQQYSTCLAQPCAGQGIPDTVWHSVASCSRQKSALQGRLAQNRTVEGDQVVIRVLPESSWLRSYDRQQTPAGSHFGDTPTSVGRPSAATSPLTESFSGAASPAVAAHSVNANSSPLSVPGSAARELQHSHSLASAASDCAFTPPGLSTPGTPALISASTSSAPPQAGVLALARR